MTCPDSGTLRASIDGELRGDTGQVADHIAGCPSCQTEIQCMQSNTQLVSAALSSLEPVAEGPVDHSLARHRIRSRQQASHRASVLNGPSMVDAEVVLRPSFIGRWRAALVSLAAALTVTWMLSTPTGQVASAQFLAQFRGQKLSVVTIDSNQSRLRLPELEALGTLQGETRQRPQRVASLEEAEQRLGTPLQQPDPSALPTGIDPKPQISVTNGAQFKYTFNRERARAYFDSKGQPEHSLPERLNGSSLTVSIPPISVMEYAALTRDADSASQRSSVVNRIGVFFAQSDEVSVGAEGAALEEIRDYLLTLPNLTESTARQLRSIQDWRNTLPIPVRLDVMSWQQVTVSGNPGYLLSENAGPGSAVIWNANGRLYGVMGGLSASEIQRVANSVR